jgi:hypothetical protein
MAWPLYGLKEVSAQGGGAERIAVRRNTLSKVEQREDWEYTSVPQREHIFASALMVEQVKLKRDRAMTSSFQHPEVCHLHPGYLKDS